MGKQNKKPTSFSMSAASLALLAKIAEQENRSMSSMLEVLVQAKAKELGVV